MAKDPAFLFYSKDWIQGTSHLMPEEKGVYIDLLAHQHQEGDLPTDTKRLARMSGMSETDFLRIWETLKSKFMLNRNNRLVNRKLTEITTERLTKGLKNKVTGIFASLIRLSNAPDEIKEEIKKSFKIADFLTETDQTLTVRLTDWFNSRLKSIGDGNEYENGSIKEVILSKVSNADFDEISEVDIGGTIQFIFILKKITLTKEEVKDYFKAFRLNNKHEPYSSKSKVMKHFREWLKLQNISLNGTNHKSVGRNNKSAGAEQLIESLKRDIIADT